MGFINPWLYKVGYAAFNDITSESAKGCDVDGFQAVKGWDAVTGFGTPDFTKLQALVMKSPPTAGAAPGAGAPAAASTSAAATKPSAPKGS